MRGTMLSDLKITYDSTQQLIKSIRNTAEQMERDAPELKDRVKVLKRKVDASSRITDQKKHLDQLKNELGWALVTSKEKDRDVYQAQMDEMDEKMVQLDDMVQEAEVSVE